MITFTSSTRYVKKKVKTAMVHEWVSGEWQTVRNVEFWAALGAPMPGAAKMMAEALLGSGRKRAWFTTVYIIFDMYAVYTNNDPRVIGIMEEIDFLPRFLASVLPPLKYKGTNLHLDRAFARYLCKKHIKIF